MSTKRELEEENENLRSTLEGIADEIHEALDIDSDSDDDSDDD
jgi:hypothetical protein